MAVLVAAMFLALVFVVAVVVNIAQELVVRRSAQAAADAAALAGAMSLAQDTSTGQTSRQNAKNAAITAAALNGFDATGGALTESFLNNQYLSCTATASTTVCFNAPPTSGAFAGSAGEVEVTVAQSTTATLVPQWGSTTVHARGVARGVPAKVGNAIYSLARGFVPGALQVQPQGVLTMYGPNGSPQPGVAQVNSSCTTSTCSSAAAVAYGGSTIGPSDCSSSSGCASVNVVGGTTGCATGPWPSSACGQSLQSDPYSNSFPRPSCPAAPPNCNSPITTIPCSGSITLAPGVYRTNWPNNCVYTLQAGVYIIEQDMSIGGNGALTGNGILLFLTGSSYDPTNNNPGSAGTCATMTLAGNGSAGGGNSELLTPADTGVYKFLLIYQDPDCNASGAGLTISGGGNISTTGTIYMPNAAVSMNGNPSQIFKGQQIVARTINVQNGNAIVDMGLSGSLPGGLVRLAE